MARNPGALTFQDEYRRASVSDVPYFTFNGKVFKTEEVGQSFQEAEQQKQQKQQELSQQQQQDQQEVEQMRKEADERQAQQFEEMTNALREMQGDVPRPVPGSDQTLKLTVMNENQSVIGGMVYDNPEKVTSPTQALPVENTATARETPWKGTIEATRAASPSYSTIPDASTGAQTEEVTPGGVEKVEESTPVMEQEPVVEQEPLVEEEPVVEPESQSTKRRRK